MKTKEQYVQDARVEYEEKRRHNEIVKLLKEQNKLLKEQNKLQEEAQA